MPKFEFRASDHSYTCDGARLPSVTQVFPWSYFKDNEEAMLRGTYVHRAIELFNNNDLNEETLDPALVNYLNAYKQFKKDFGLSK
jgi:hypothetical protein